MFEKSHVPFEFSWSPLYNVDDRCTMLLKELKFVNKNKNTDAVFCICIEHDSKARNRNLGFTSVR